MPSNDSNAKSSHPTAKRIGKLRKQLRSEGVDAMLVTNITNVRYLTGFTGSSGYLLIDRKSEILLSDTRYTTQLADQCPDLKVDIRDARSTIQEAVARVVTASKYRSLAVEAHKMVKSEFDALSVSIPACELISSNGWVEAQRAIKDPIEIQAIRESIDINQRAFRVIVAQLTGQQTERQIAHNLEHQMRAFGAKGCGFPPIVGVGARAALPHGVPGETKIAEAPFVLIDWGTNHGGYLSDLTRMVITGKVNSRFEKIYKTVLQAQLAAIKKIRPGVSLKAVDRAARNVIEKAGFGDFFGHGTGHSFGLEIHELPYFSPIHDGVLEPGMVLTVEPGIYLPGIAGVRIEDDVLVTKDGHEVLSDLPKDLEQCVVHLGE